MFTTEMGEMLVGREFLDFQSLSSAIDIFEQTNFTQLYKRDCRTIEVGVRKNTRKKYNAAIGMHGEQRIR